MTGCGLAAADEFRRRLGTDQQAEVETYFRAKAMENKWDIDVIDEVWQTVASFGSFGFCKAHGAAFAIPTFESAWLKTHHPAAFMAAVLDHHPGTYPQRLMVAGARPMGIEILPVDVNESTTGTHLERVPETQEAPEGRWGIRLSLTTVLGLAQNEMRRLERSQPFDSLADLRDRARLSKKSFEHLAQLGPSTACCPPPVPVVQIWSTTSSFCIQPPNGIEPDVPCARGGHRLKANKRLLLVSPSLLRCQLSSHNQLMNKKSGLNSI